jgi:hypothetical protein
MSRFSIDPLQDFLTALPTPGAGLHVSPAFEKIKKEYGVDVAKDFLAAYRHNDDEAATRVARKIANDDGCQIAKTSLGYVFNLANERHEVEPPKKVVGPEGVDGYRSEAHAILGAGLMLRMRMVSTPINNLEEERELARQVVAGNRIF